MAEGIDPRRVELVERARKGWIARLTDLSRRNNLLYFRDLTAGTMDLTPRGMGVAADLVAGRALSASQIACDGEDARSTLARMKEVRRRAQENSEERGLATLFLGIGLATWTELDGGRPPAAPIVLVPLQFEARGRDSFELRRAGDPVINPVLLYVLQSQFGCPLTETDLLPLLDGADAGSGAPSTFTPEGPFDALVMKAKAPSFAISRRLVVGNFSFQKMAMVNDLRDNAAMLARHDIIAAISGFAGVRDKLHSAGERSAGNLRALDERSPDLEFLVFSADSSQQNVVERVLSGRTGVVQGPPGTGKSQTISNLVTSLVARGKRILFVAEKRAALDVVLDRLTREGLRHIALDLHGADVSRRAVMAQLDESLKLVRDTPPVNLGDTHVRFSEQRTRLNDHVRRLHDVRDPSRKSVYELQGELLLLPPEAAVRWRWRQPALATLTPVEARRLRDLLAEARESASLVLRTDPSPWTHAALADGRSAQDAVDLVLAVREDSLPALRRLVDGFARATSAREPKNLPALLEAIDVLDHSAAALHVFSPDIFAQTSALVRAFEPAARGFFAMLWAFLFDAAYREARRTLHRLRVAGPAPAAQIFGELEQASAVSRDWRAQLGSATPPTDYARRDELRRATSRLQTQLRDLANYVADPGLGDLSFSQLASRLDALAADRGTALRIPRIREIERAIGGVAGEGLLRDLRDRRIPTDRWLPAFDHAYLSSCLEAVQAGDPRLSGFQGRAHDAVAREFRDLDRRRTDLAKWRVRRAHAEQAVEAMNTHREQAAIVQREAKKKARHVPVRTLLREAPDVLTALRPCWMASPLSVSQLLGTDRLYFDVVIFDEASQILPEDAVSALMRAPQAVVAGDSRQLPPTTFFATGADDSDEEHGGASEGFDSLLDIMDASAESWPLEWHYRSQDESLISFSNRWIYQNSLVTFASPGGPPRVSHELVDASLHDGQDESSSEEVRRVVELVLEHAATRPGESLGVIAFGIKHQQRIEAALDRAREERHDLDGFFGEGRDEPFFVKNLERVQGDERDAIFLSVGYGKDRSGRLSYRFGPLLYKGGERRLNVAITRARRRMTLISSFSHRDMDPDRCRSEGTVLLRRYLEFMASNGAVLGDEGRSEVAMNAFERDVHRRLTDSGIPLEPQWGVSKYRLDFAAKHPQQAGRFVLAIECDGASYHSAYTARDRDRLRQEHLEALGWRFHRIWSTDWFQRRDEEIARTVAAFREAVRAADETAEPPLAALRAPPVHARSAYVPAERVPTEEPIAATTKVRGPRPEVTPRAKIADFRPQEIEAVVRWIVSDLRLRTDEEIIDEAVRELGFQRRGVKIVAAIEAAIRRVGG